MGTIRTTWRRRAATTVVAGASVLALAAPGVSAAPAAGPDQFVGKAEALALDLDLTLPAGLASQAGKIEQLISQTLTQLDSQGKVAAKADLLTGLLNEPPLQFTGSKKSDATSIAAQDLGIVKVGIGELSYTADAENRVTKAASELLNLRVGLTDTEAADLALEDLLERLNELIGSEQDAESPVSEGTLNDVLGTIEDLADAKLTEDVKIPTIGPTDLLQLPDTADLTNLVSIDKLWSETSTLTEAASNAIVSSSEAGVIDLSLLGGLVKVPEFEFSSLAKTNGKPGGASAEAVTKKLAVQLADKDVISLDGDTLKVGGEVLDLGELGLTGQLADLQELLKSILNLVGLDIAQAKETEVAAADGSHALASTEALAISLSPLQGLVGQDPVGGLNVALSLLPTLAEVRADNAAPAQPKPQAPAVQRPAPSKSLPRTGGGLAILGGLALAGAFALRRFTKS